LNRRYNFIESLSVNGSVSSDQPVIRDHIVQFYETLFSEQYNWRPRMDDLAFNSLDAEETSRLELPFEEREVLEVVKGMNRDKALGPNGFSMAFFQDCWDVIKTNIMGVFSDFHAPGKFEKSLNASFIALIRKKFGDDQSQGLMAYYLVSGVYKIIAKVLANRMSHVMEKIISKP
jgi:hypothetical protein